MVQADRWAKSNTALKGDALAGAVAKQSWDDSVKSLVQVPSVLDMMSQQLDWTQKLGDAVLAQQADVMDAIQRLRSRARANGKLESTSSNGYGQDRGPEATDRDRAGLARRALRSVLRARRGLRRLAYPDYAPYYFPPAYGYVAGAALASGVCFPQPRLAVRHAFWSSCDWGRGNINVVTNRSASVANINRGKWEHNADHRHGVRYNNADVRQKFAKTDIQAGKAARQDFRGKDGQKVLRARSRPPGCRRP